MISKKSRYAKTRPLSSGKGLRPRSIQSLEGVIEHEVQQGDRLDTLARHYYKNDRLWWRIIDANPDLLYGQTFPEPAKAGEPDEGVPSVMLLRHREGDTIFIPQNA